MQVDIRRHKGRYTQENLPEVRLNGNVLINAMKIRFDYFTDRAETTQEGKMKNISTLPDMVAAERQQKKLDVK